MHRNQQKKHVQVGIQQKNSSRAADNEWYNKKSNGEHTDELKLNGSRKKRINVITLMIILCLSSSGDGRLVTSDASSFFSSFSVNIHQHPNSTAVRYHGDSYQYRQVVYEYMTVDLYMRHYRVDWKNVHSPPNMLIILLAMIRCWSTEQWFSIDSITGYL